MLAMTFRIIWGHTFLISLVNLETFAQTEISFTSKMFEIRWRRTAIVERSIHQHFIISDAYEH
jgi:mRNA deadenylase 3'-5' endonuclease subunit Ccr4